LPRGGISLDQQGWISRRPGFLLPARAVTALSTPVFSKAGRRLRHGCLQFFADQAALSEPPAFEWLCHHSAIN